MYSFYYLPGLQIETMSKSAGLQAPVVAVRASTYVAQTGDAQALSADQLIESSLYPCLGLGCCIR